MSEYKVKYRITLHSLFKEYSADGVKIHNVKSAQEAIKKVEEEYETESKGRDLNTILSILDVEKL